MSGKSMPRAWGDALFRRNIRDVSAGLAAKSPSDRHLTLIGLLSPLLNLVGRIAPGNTPIIARFLSSSERGTLKPSKTRFRIAEGYRGIWDCFRLLHIEVIDVHHGHGRVRSVTEAGVVREPLQG